MKHLLAALVALAVLVAAGSHHAHAADAVGGEVLDLSPAEAPACEVVLAPGLAPVTGAPLGAIPGQSPPA